MLSREQYAEIVSSYLVELNHIIKNATPDDLKALPGFSEEMAEYVADLRDSDNDTANVLSAAFGLVDEYAAGVNKEEVLAAGYEAYRLLCEQGKL